MEKETYITENAGQTQKIATAFAEKISPGDSILLEGELGSGKTTFVQGVARSFKIKSRIISPTFVLVRKHKILRSNEQKIKTLYHLDLYRIDNPEELEDLGLAEIFQDPYGIVFIEWGEKSQKSKFAWKISLKVLGKNKREIIIRKNE
jgi:tRNA threonylcarbamoyladenosine biosynthesis protein TsaE